MRSTKAMSVILVTLGILLILLPLSSYYFGSYIHFKFKGEIKQGSEFRYGVIVGQFWDNSSHKEFLIGVVLDIHRTTGNTYNINYTIYRLLGNGRINVHSSIPFSAQKISLEKTGNQTVIGRNALIDQLFPENLPNNVKTIHTFPSDFYGYPKVYITNSGSEYLKYENTYAVLSAHLQDPCKTLGTLYPKMHTYCAVLSKAYGNQTLAKESLLSEVYIVNGNTAPPQDWGGWIKYGISSSFPVNFILILLGIILAIIESRQ